MKLSGPAAKEYLRKPDAAHTAILIFGADAMRVADARTQSIKFLVGPQGEEEMRLTRINAADLRKDPALLDDAIKAQGFFPGHRVAFVEDATDGLAKTLEAALADWQPGDAQVIITAGQLTAKSALRKVVENHRNAVSIGLYDDPPSGADIELAISDAGLERPSQDVMDQLLSLANSLEPGDFRQTLEKISLYKLSDNTPLTLEDVAACAPQSADADVDDILDAVTDGQPDQLGPLLRNLTAQGVLPVTLCIQATRHFRRLHMVASDPNGPASGVGRLRPPVFGPRRDKISRQAGRWGRDRLERALTALTDLDLQLRSAQSAPPAALAERTFIRLAMIARQ
ncbi:DNA polymerase III subunit delta [Yoonia litorea]|uniref:DNA-directed DNA polymerase n=1 Tax=Yoonia litorea TaxID=1123755 RepID=A0A1I6MX14_9RHOB|nr:DNA polymerase III subunit delta [Yoonia litorea]SFS20167.1 DNA polymerase III, delta subunit [Yoonia litorea]